MSETIARARGSRADRQTRVSRAADLGQWVFHLVRSEHRLALCLPRKSENGQGAKRCRGQLRGFLAHGVPVFTSGIRCRPRALERCEGLAIGARAFGLERVAVYAAILAYLGLTWHRLGYSIGPVRG